MNEFDHMTQLQCTITLPVTLHTGQTQSVLLLVYLDGGEGKANKAYIEYLQHDWWLLKPNDNNDSFWCGKMIYKCKTCRCCRSLGEGGSVYIRSEGGFYSWMPWSGAAPSNIAHFKLAGKERRVTIHVIW